MRSVRSNEGGSGLATCMGAGGNGVVALIVNVGSSLGSRCCSVMNGTAAREGNVLIGGATGGSEGTTPTDSTCLARALRPGGVIRRCASTTAASCENRHRSPYRHAPWTMCLHASCERSTLTGVSATPLTARRYVTRLNQLTSTLTVRINAIVTAPTDPRAIEATDLLEFDVSRVQIGTLLTLGAAPVQEVLAHLALGLLLFLLFALAFLALGHT